MSAIDFLIQGGVTSASGDMSHEEKLTYSLIVENVANKVKELGNQHLIPFDLLSIFNLNFLFIAKDQFNFHFAFVDMAGTDEIKIRDFTSFEKPLPLTVLIDQLKIEYGEVHWAFTVPIQQAKKLSVNEIEEYAYQYIETINKSLEN